MGLLNTLSNWGNEIYHSEPTQWIAHQTGKVAAPAADIIGDVTGNHKYNRVASAIRNPNVTLANPLQLNHGGQSGFSYASPAQYAQTVHQPGSQGGASKTGNTSVLNGGSSGGGGSQFTPMELAAFNRWSGKASRGLGQAKTAYHNELEQLGNTYAHRQNILNSNRDQANQQYQQGQTKNRGNLLTNVNAAREGARNDTRGLLNLVAMYGNPGGSFATRVAPNLVQGTFENNLNRADQNYAQNEQGLDNAHHNFMTAYNQNIGELDTWRDKNKKLFGSQYNKTRNHLNDILQGIGDRSGTPASFGSEVRSVLGGIPDAVTYDYAWNGKTPTYQAPELSSYEQSPTEVQAQAQQATQGIGGHGTPYFLQQMQQRRKQNQGGGQPFYLTQ
jgi:hypothetical protein